MNYLIIFLILPILFYIKLGYGAELRCNLLFSDLNQQSVIQELQQLPPLQLDYSKYNRSMQMLLSSVSELSSEWSKIIDVEKQFANGKIDHRTASNKANEISQSLASRASEILRKKIFNTTERHLLEAYKILIYQASRLHSATQEDLKKKHQSQPPQNHESNKTRNDQEPNKTQQQQSQASSKQKSLSPESNDDQKAEQGSKKSNSPRESAENQKEQGKSTEQGKASADSTIDHQKSAQQNGKQIQRQKSDGSGSNSFGKESKPLKNQADTLAQIVQEKSALQRQVEQQRKNFARTQDTAALLDKVRKDIENFKNEEAESLKPEKKLERTIRPLSEQKKAELIKALVEDAYGKILKNYFNSDGLLSALGAFKTTLQTLFSENGDYYFLKQLAVEVEQLRETLSATNIFYNKFEDLGLSMIASIDATQTNILRKLNFLDHLFNEVKKRASLTAEEEILHQNVKHLILLAGTPSTPTDKQLGSAFISQLKGPLSRDVIFKTYGSERAKDGINWKKLADDIRRGHLNDLLIYAKLNPYMNMLLNTTMTARKEKIANGDWEPINENDPELHLAQELDRFQFFYRDGAPLEVDLLKFISGDMLENTYYDDTIRHNPKLTHPKKVSIVAYDFSGSMKGTKTVVRNALIGSYLDKTQIDVVAGKAEHTVYTMGFADYPATPEKIATLAQAQDYFDRLRNAPIGNGSGTSITNAIVEIYETIAQQEKEGGSLNRANILLITDAEDTIDLAKVRAARAKVSKNVDIRFNAITLGKHKFGIQELLRVEAENSDIGALSHQHISYKEISSIINDGERLSALETAARFYDQRADHEIEKMRLIQLKNQMSGLEEKQQMNASAKVIQFKSLMNLLNQARSIESDDKIDHSVNLFMSLVATSYSARWTLSDKIKSFSDFVSRTANDLNISQVDFIKMINDYQREQLKKWMSY